MTDKDEKRTTPLNPEVRAMAEEFVKSAAREDCFAVAIMFDMGGRQLMMARTHTTDDFYAALHQIVDIYRDSERSGDVQHERIHTYEN